MTTATLLRRYIGLCESETKLRTALPDNVIRAFEELGDLQRGEPEAAMLRVQFAMGGGVLNPVVEHVGDITHRMSHRVRYGMVEGRSKIHETLKSLTSGYGFERDMRENIVSEARLRNVPAAQVQAGVTKALRGYAKAHEALPVYNKAQWLAREAAVSIGLEDFDSARLCLQQLKDMSPTDEAFAEHAMKYSTDAQGNLLPYRPY